MDTMTNNHVYPKFSYSFLHPRYWLTWLGIILLYIIVSLPYPLIHFIGYQIGHLSLHFCKRRAAIAKRNIELCFPQYSEQEKHQLLIRNFESTGMAIFETGMAWFWSDKRIKKWVNYSGLENISKIKGKRGILLLGMHFLTLELGARAFGIITPGIGVYRPHDNPLMDWLQTKGRLRSNKYMLNRRDIRGMISALKEGELLWYAPDHDYGLRNSVFVPFFAVKEAATTIGTSILMRMGHSPALIPFVAIRNDGNKGYTLHISEEAKDFPLDDEVAAAAYVNKIIEEEIMLAPEQYMWLHRRFKTRPTGQKSVY